YSITGFFWIWDLVRLYSCWLQCDFTMTQLFNVILYLFFLFISLSSCGQKNLDININSYNRGDYCYILWTSDTTLSNPNSNTRLTFDKKNVAYVHRSLQVDKNWIRIMDETGKNISDNMINIMGDVGNNYLSFYNPRNEEVKLHPHYDQYYQNKFFMPNNGLHKWTRFDLERMGYKVDN
ncbi:MAG: hypothetical protein ABI921_15525, partial [Panacibacter sp.]